MRNNSTVNTVVREQYSIRASKDPARTTSSMSAATTETTSSSTATEMDAAWKITTISTWIGFPRPSLVVYEESIDAAMTITFSTLATYESSISTPDTSTLTSISRSPPTAGLLSISSTSLAGTVSTTAPSRTSSDPLGTPSLTPSSTTIQATSSASPTDAVSIPISNHVSTRRISRAAFAGGLIGAAVAAALLTALIIICCHRSRRARRSTETPNDTYPVDWFTSQNRPPVGRYEKPLAHPNRAWEPLLPQSADDRTIQVAIKTLFDKLEVHVENFYTPRHVHITSDRHRNLAAVDSGLLSESLDRVMADTLSPLNLIKHWIAYFVTYMMSPGNGELSLLPKEYSNLPAGLANMNVCTPQSNADSQAYSLWCVLTVYLHQTSRTQEQLARDRSQAVTNGASLLSEAFVDWQSDLRNEDAARDNLIKLMHSAYHTAHLIVSQPSTFAFDWQPCSRSGATYDEATLIVLPGFVKTTDEHGNALDQPHELVGAVESRI